MSLIFSLFFVEGWYRVNINDADNFNYKFDPRSYVSKTKRDVFIDKTNFEIFKNCEMTKLQTKRPTRSTLESINTNYIVETTNNYEFSESIPAKKLYNNYFVIENPSKHQLKSIYEDKHILDIQKQDPIKFSTRFEAGFLETGSTDLGYQNGYMVSPRTLNLTGSNEIVTVTDTGIDYKHPMFFDSNIELKPNTENMNHRKIIYYDAWKDFIDHVPGHGTHTAAIISGKATCGNVMPLYNGIAPDSKLNFLDLGLGNAKDIYDNFNKEVFVKRMKSYNSGIASNSWGNKEEDGTKIATSLWDEIAYNNSDILFLFAAGNNAKEMTIESPSAAKNVFCVGATEATPGQKMPDSNLPQILFDGKVISLIQTPWSKNLWDLMQGEEPVFDVSKPLYTTIESSCDSISSASSNSKVVIIRNSIDCAETQSVVLATNSQEDFDAIKSSSKANFSFKLSEYNREKKADFASSGPAYSGILKPDISAPGEVVGPVSYGSASSERECTAKTLNKFSGTSEATPMIAGLATLLREKLRGIGHVPTSSLLKSMLIASSPDDYSLDLGHGIPQLNRALNASFADNQKISGLSHLAAEFDSETGEVTASISWLDPVLPRDAAYPIYADLDLVLEDPNGKYYYVSKNFAILTTNKKVIAKSAAGKWKAHVLSANFDGEVSFAFSVVNNKFEKILFKEETKCLIDSCNCNSKGVCRCESGYAGNTCDIKMKESNTFLGASLAYFRFTVPEINKPRLDIKFRGSGSFYLIKGDSWYPHDSFGSIDFRNVASTETHSNYEVLEPGTKITIVARTFNSGSIKFDFVDSSFIPATPFPSASEVPVQTPAIPPIRTNFPTPNDNNDDQEIVLFWKQPFAFPLMLAACVLAGVIMIIVIALITVKLCKKPATIRTTDVPLVL